MSRPQARQAAVIERRYRVQEDACAQAVELLLKNQAKKKAGGSDAGDEEKGPKSDRPVSPILPR